MTFLRNTLMAQLSFNMLVRSLILPPRSPHIYYVIIFPLVGFTHLTFVLSLSEMTRGRGRKPTRAPRPTVGSRQRQRAGPGQTTAPEGPPSTPSAAPSDAAHPEGHHATTPAAPNTAGETATAPIGREEVASMIGAAVSEAVSRLTREIRQGGSPEPEVVPDWGLGPNPMTEPVISLDNPMELSGGGPTSLSRSTVNASIRQKILSHKYVDVKSLLLPHERPAGSDDIQYLVAEDGKVTLGSAPRKDDLSVAGWTRGFLRYAMVYIEGYPHEAGAILRYMSLVMDLTSRGLGRAWQEYDEAFRKAREVSPGNYPWDSPPQLLWMGAVASGLATFQGDSRDSGAEKPIRGPGPSPRRSFPPRSQGPLLGSSKYRCIDFNSARGCSWSNCRFQHVCTRCNGAHSAVKCQPQGKEGLHALGAPPL